MVESWRCWDEGQLAGCLAQAACVVLSERTCPLSSLSSFAAVARCNSLAHFASDFCSETAFKSMECETTVSCLLHLSFVFVRVSCGVAVRQSVQVVLWLEAVMFQRGPHFVLLTTVERVSFCASERWADLRGCFEPTRRSGVS